MASVDLVCNGTHAFSYKSLQCGLEGSVFRRNDVSTGFRLPGGTSGLLIEQVRSWRTVSRPDNSLLFFREISGEEFACVGAHSDAAIGDLDA